MAQQETSALFSLQELMRLENDRVRQEQELRRKQAEAAESARREAEKNARDRELARLRLEEGRRRQEEGRIREEAARTEALRAAEVERVRVETLERARSDALTIQRAHEKELAILGAGDATRRLRRILWVASLSCVVIVAAGVSLYFGRIQPRANEEARALEALVAEQRAARERMQKDLDLQSQRVRELQDRVQEEQEAARRALKVDAAPTVDKPGGKRRIQKPPPPPPPCTCDQRDPLCGCFKR